MALAINTRSRDVRFDVKLFPHRRLAADALATLEFLRDLELGGELSFRGERTATILFTGHTATVSPVTQDWTSFYVRSPRINDSPEHQGHGRPEKRELEPVAVSIVAEEVERDRHWPSPAARHRSDASGPRRRRRAACAAGCVGSRTAASKSMIPS